MLRPRQSQPIGAGRPFAYPWYPVNPIRNVDRDDGRKAGAGRNGGYNPVWVIIQG